MWNIQREAILSYRKGEISKLLERRGLAGAIVCNGIRENLDSWLLASAELPILQPFGRLNLFLISESGDTTPLCAITNHPCDFPHYDLFKPGMLTPFIRDHRLGIVNPECLLEVTAEALTAYDGSLELVDITNDLSAAKARKCEEEIEAIAEGVRFIEKVFKAMPWFLRPGQSESRIAVDLRRTIASLGAPNPMLSEDPMAATLIDLTSAPKDGLSECEDTDFPGRILTEDDRINLCVHTYLQGGFSAAFGRSYVMGEPTDENLRCWDLAVRAQDLLAGELRPGTTVAGAVEKLDRDILEPEGYPPVRGNCVYGIGCSRCEAPRNVDATGYMELEEGMTLVLAPEVCPEGKDPYCCMDVFVIRKDGAERLGCAPRTLMEL